MQKKNLVPRVCNFDRQIVVPQRTERDFDVKFYSRIESGNLLRVVKVPIKHELHSTGFAAQIAAEYDLYLEPDTMTDGLMHWFNFKIMT